MKRDRLKPGEGRKKQEGKGQAERYFLLRVETSVTSQEKPFPHGTWICSALSPEPSSFPTLFLQPAGDAPSHMSWEGAGPRPRGWADASCGAGVHRGYEAPAKEGGEGGLELAQRKWTKALLEKQKKRSKVDTHKITRLRTLRVREIHFCIPQCPSS